MRKLNRKSGVTVIEMVVGLMIMGLVLTGASAMFISGLKSYERTDLGHLHH